MPPCGGAVCRLQQQKRQWNSLDCYRPDAATQRHKISGNKAKSFHFMASFARGDSRAGCGLVGANSRMSICGAYAGCALIARTFLHELLVLRNSMQNFSLKLQVIAILVTTVAVNGCCDVCACQRCRVVAERRERHLSGQQSLRDDSVIATRRC